MRKCAFCTRTARWLAADLGAARAGGWRHARDPRVGLLLGLAERGFICGNCGFLLSDGSQFGGADASTCCSS